MLSEAFEKLKSNLELNDTFQSIVETHHKAVRSVIEKAAPGLNSKLIGSLQRRTRIQPRKDDEFDIDILIELGSFNGWVSQGITARDALIKLGEHISQSQRYQSMDPYTDAPTVCFHYQDGVKVELVPAYRNQIGTHQDGQPCLPVGRGYWIPSETGSWKHADYDYDAEKITEMNKLTDGWLIPTIKMLKAIRRQFSPKLESFHLEVLAWHTVPNIVVSLLRNRSEISYSILIASFFESAKHFLSQPIKMGESNSPAQIVDAEHYPAVLKAFETLSRYSISILQMNSEREQLAGWREIYGDLLPMN